MELVNNRFLRYRKVNIDFKQSGLSSPDGGHHFQSAPKMTINNSDAVLDMLVIYEIEDGSNGKVIPGQNCTVAYRTNGTFAVMLESYNEVQTEWMNALTHAQNGY